MTGCSVEEARRHVDRIARSRQEGSDELKDALAGALQRVTMMFPATGNFLMEFLQNADDAASTAVFVEIAPNGVRIANNGTPFSPEDVESICRLGRSSKKPTDYIGYLGIGFKSVFLFSDAPRIVSGCYRFGFERDSWPNPDAVPWQITPIWLEEPPEWVSSLPSHRTFFELPFRRGYEPSIIERLKKEIRADILSPRVLLFLRHVEEVVLRDQIHGAERVLRRKRLPSPGEATSPYELYELSEEQRDARLQRWVVFRSTVSVPEEVRTDWVTREWERHEVASREIAVAFLLDRSGQLQREDKGTAHMGVFSFLPLKEVPSGLSFLVQGDFLTGPGRETIRRDALWNRWVARELFGFITRTVVPVLMAHDRWRYVITNVLYPGLGGPEIINEELILPLRRYVQEERLLVAADGSFVAPKEAIELPVSAWDSEWFRVAGIAGVEALFPGRKVLDRHTAPHGEISRLIKEGPSVDSVRWPSAMQRLVEDRAQERDTMFFKTLYRELGRYQEGTIRRAPWSSAPIVLTEDGQLVPASSSYWSEVGTPGPLGRRRVHPDIGADPECIRFLEIIGCHVMTSDEVTRAQVLEIFAQHPEKWSALSDEERLELTGHFFRAWQNGVLSTRTLEFLTVKAHDGKWYRPGEVFFSQVFAPSERLEVLLARGLLKVGPEEMRLLSDEYLGLRCGSPYEWRRFFDELGVGRRLVAERLRESFTERVAEEVLIRYEKKSGRRPVRVARSQERGYDFESNGRRIELKGRSDPRPVISLTKQQYQTLHESGSYVYVVSDALNNPELFILRGKRLLDLVPDPSFAYQEWHGLCEDRYVALADEGEGEIRA